MARDSTIEVEQCGTRHPGVLEGAVVGMWGEPSKAFVTLRPGSMVSEQEIIEFCRQHIAHFKAPVAIEFCELPKKPRPARFRNARFVRKSERAPATH